MCGILLIGANAGRAGEIQFADVTQEQGLVIPLQGMMGHGAAWGDANGDGRPDLVVGGFCDRPNEEYAPAGGPVPIHLLLNKPDGFVVDAVPTLKRFGRTSGAVFADFNNDGVSELYIANNAKAGTPKPGTSEPQASAKHLPSLFLTYRDGQWADISTPSGAIPEGMLTARNIGVFDIDGDSLLDLLIVEDRFRKGPRSRLLRNTGNLTFVDVTAKYGLPDDLFGLGHAVADLNDDGQPDFFVGHSNRLFLSTPSGKYAEHESTTAAFAWQPLHGEDWPCGAAFADLDRDGDFDLVLALHCETARNRVYLNEGLVNGVPQFRDATREVGLPESIPVKCPHVEVQDFDNDGWPDIYLSAGWRDDKGHTTPLIFRHQGLSNGKPRFAVNGDLTAPMVYYPCGPSADFDNDGKIDLFLVNWFSGDHCHLLQNTSTSGNCLDVTVRGNHFNRMGIGTRIKVYPAGQLGQSQALLGCQELHIGTGYASGHMPVCHFGLGSIAAVDLRIRFPNGQTLDLRGIDANQHLQLTDEE